MTEDQTNKNSVAIIGAGIIGCYLGLRLCEKGFKVTVFEKNNHHWPKPCSGLISERIKDFIPITEDIYLRKIESILVHFPPKDINLKLFPPLLLFDRTRLDNFVFNLAEKSGVKFIFGKEIKLPLRGFFRIIACDGAMSYTRDFLRLPKPELRLGVQFLIKEETQTQEIEIWPKVFNKKEYGFLWKIPKNNTAEYGGIGPAGLIKSEIESFLKKENIDVINGEWKAHLIPQGIKLPTSQEITILGDAAGMTKPTTGGGVIWGLKATDILVNNFSDFSKYKKEIEKFFRFKELKGNLMVYLARTFGQNFSFFLPKSLTIDADLF